MTGRRTSHPIKGLWTGLLTLLLFSTSVNSESTLNVTAASTHGAKIEESLGDSSSRKIESIVESTTTSLREQNGESPEARIEAVEKIISNRTSETKIAETRNEPIIKTEKLKIEEKNLEERKIEVKRLVKESLPEFSEKDNYDEIHELDENDSREPTTRATKKRVEKNGSSDKDNEDEIFKRNPEMDFSLVNDTNVNYITKKNVKEAKDDDDYENNYKNIKSILENPTNVIKSGDDQLEKVKGPKSQVEVIKNTTMPKILRLSEKTDEEHLEVTSLKNLPTDKIKMDVLSSIEIPNDTKNDNKTLQTPRARTISFGGTNEFLTHSNKTGDSRRIFGSNNSSSVTGIMEKSGEEKIIEEEKLSSFKPYPYLKVKVDDVRSNATTSGILLPVISSEKNEEVSALENTIGQSKENMKNFVTESSVVIDNSIQQFKPTYPKRSSSNSSRTTLSSVEPKFSTTPSDLPDDIKIVTTESMSLENFTTQFFAGNLRLSNTENKVPRENEEGKSVESLDLTGNGITEVMQTDKNNHSSIMIEKPETRKTTALPTNGNAVTRLTDINLMIENTTEKMATSSDKSTIVAIQTEVDNSMSKISPLNVFDTLTKSSTTETPSITTISMQTSTMLTNITSSNFTSTKIDQQLTTASPQSSEIFFTGETMESLDGSTSSETPMVSTTSNVEYEFVGLTDNAISQKYTQSTENSNVFTKENGEFTSSSSSSLYLESSTPSLISISSTPSSTSMEIETTVENFETSTYPGTFVTEIDTSEENSTIISFSNFDTNEPEETTSLPEDNDLLTTTNDFFSTETINDSLETTTEQIPEDVTNFTKITDIVTEVKNLSTESGRSVDKSTSMPEISTSLANSSESFDVVSTESSNLSIVTDSSEFMETSRSSDEDSSPSKSSIETTAMSDEPESISESSSTLKNFINVETTNNTDNDNRAVSPDDLTSLVRIIFEGNWPDVCPHLPALRQSLADLLTSGLEKIVLASQIIFQKNPCTEGFATSIITTELSVTTILLYVVDKNGKFDAEMTKMLPTLYSKSPIKLQVTIHSFQLVQDADSGNAIAVVVVSSVAFICLVLLAGLLFIMRKRQTRFNYGERCRPVSLDAYSLDSVSAYNSVRARKGAARASKRSYGNPTFEDSTATPSHPLNFAGLSTFCNEQNTIAEEFSGIPQVTARIDELPQGAEVKNRYANVVPLPETRVPLMKINNDPLTEYINASYVRGPKNATKYYVACQAPIDSTVTDFWRMIWEQQTKVVIMLTDLVENGVEKCAEYLPPSEVTDCHRLFGDFQVTLKKRETKEKYAISTLHLKNLENNTFREISHIWYLWPANGVQSDAAGLIAVLLEARALQRGGPGPVVVHCSPGTGRTGTLIALDLGIRQYEITRTVDVPRVVYTIRRDRAGAVQTKEQYAFIYKALNLYATKLAGGALES